MKFARLYIEEKAYAYPLTAKILNEFKNLPIINIENYKDVFCKSSQSFRAQKQNPSIILAIKKENFLYPLPEICQKFGHLNAYYSSILLNCPYDCGYCYLQGAYPSANMLLYVNVEDFISEVKSMSVSDCYVAVSYDTDLLAMERYFGLCNTWIRETKDLKNTEIEIRTKSVDVTSINEFNDNVVFAFTLSPNEVCNKYERGSPALAKRLQAVKYMIDKGYKVRLVFDPILKIDNYIQVYKEFFEQVFSSINWEQLVNISIGTFRISSKYLKNMRQDLGPASCELAFYPFEVKNGIAFYHDKHNIKEQILEEIRNYIPLVKCF